MTGRLEPSRRPLTESLPMPAAYFALILRGYGVTPRHRAALVAGTGVDADRPGGARAEITLGQQLRQIQNANRLLDPDWSLAMGASFHPATHGPMGLAVISAATLRRSIEVMTRFSEVRAPHFRLHAHEVGSEVHLVPEDRVHLGEAEKRALLGIVLLSTQHLLESARGRSLAEGRFELPFAAPENTRPYKDYFHADVRFGCAAPAVVIPREWLDLECPLADPVLFDVSFSSLAAFEGRLHGSRHLAPRVEQIVAARGRGLRSSEVARTLGVSRRTLVRRLEREGTSYQQLLEAALKSKAAIALRESDLTVAELAFALGYEDAANFGRAFRRWFGVSPGTFRNR